MNPQTLHANDTLRELGEHLGLEWVNELSPENPYQELGFFKDSAGKKTPLFCLLDLRFTAEMRSQILKTLTETFGELKWKESK